MGARIMLIPDSIELRVLSSGRPLSGAWIELTFPMPRKNAFHSCHGPSGADGRIVVMREDILRWARVQREFAMMDSEDLESSWLGPFRARVMNESDLARAAAAALQFGEFVKYPEGYHWGLDAALRASRATPLTAIELQLTAPIEAGVVAQLDPIAPSRRGE